MNLILEVLEVHLILEVREVQSLNLEDREMQSLNLGVPRGAQCKVSRAES